MTTKTKATLLTAVLFFALLAGAQAQEKYEYAVVYYNSAAKAVDVVRNAGVEQTPAAKNEAREVALIKKIEEMNKEGWEVYNTTESVSTGNSTYFLRKKMKE